MQIRVVPAGRSDHEALRNLFQLYAYDFSEVLRTEVDETGRFRQGPLDPYWTDSWRFPFMLRSDEHLAGFALVDRKSKLSGAEDVWDMAEFFVLRKYRRAGLGTRAAHLIFALHAGRWEVRQRHANATATSFWRSAISDYTGRCFSEELCENDRWRGPVQRFTSGGRAPSVVPP